jgi:4-aminobutyrate aminotransferase-like enzyme
MASKLQRGDLLPEILVPPPGPRSRELSRRLEHLEAPALKGTPRGEPTLLWEEALGSNVLDVDGNRYIDLTSGFGVAAIGHRHPRVVAALQAQSEVLIHGLGDVHAHPSRLELLQALSRLAPMEDALVYLAISGSDAVEIALKTALLATGRPGVLAFEPAYHGLTLGALNVTARARFRQPFEPHLHPHLCRLPFGCSDGRLDEALAEGDIGCVLVEPIVGREGVLLPPDGWLAEVAAAARRSGALFVADEIFTAFGRTGALFASTGESVEPDLLCCGKALGGGMPIAAVLGRRELMEAWPDKGEALHTATFHAHPLACAAAASALDVICQEDLVGRAARLESLILSRLNAESGSFAGVHEIRGRGLLWGIEMESSAAAQRVVTSARQHGLLLLAGGPQGNVLQIVPPLVVARPQLDLALDLLVELLRA